MVARLSDTIVRQIEAVIEEMSLPQAVKDQTECEVVPFMAPDPQTRGAVNLNYMIGIGLPTSGGDAVMFFHPLEDPHSRTEIGMLVRRLFSDVQHQVTREEQALQGISNGERRSEGGLLLP